MPVGSDGGRGTVGGHGARVALQTVAVAVAVAVPKVSGVGAWRAVKGGAVCGVSSTG